MQAERIGFLHPGAMGISLAATAKNSGLRVFWASEGRSTATRTRAERIAIEDAGTLADLCAACTILVSICPPHAAEELAQQVQACGFAGLYVDANAIAPQRAIRIGGMLEAAGMQFVDGGIIGGPAWEPGSTRLYLAGPQAAAAAACFAAGPLEPHVLGPAIGAASALKMSYAAYTKGATALLGAILAVAEEHGVRTALEAQWEHDDPGSAGRTLRRARGSTAKAWRFVGEMEEIAATFRAAGLPGGFHDAAAEIYRRQAQFKDAANPPEIAELLAALTTSADSTR
jgi:3-hydroxyisobutyrate dehydrogenase-like beta-hydroxyacid dehydrogenase